jgi:hypothetical protein
MLREPEVGLVISKYRGRVMPARFACRGEANLPDAGISGFFQLKIRPTPDSLAALSGL